MYIYLHVYRKQRRSNASTYAGTHAALSLSPPLNSISLAITCTHSSTNAQTR